MSFFNNKGILFTILMIIVSSAAMHAYNGGLLFLQIEPSSRAGAMAKAYVAQSDDGFATYWNPGAMSFNRKTQFALMHSNWFEDVFDDMYYEYFSWNQFFEDIGNLGVAVTYITYGEQTATDIQGDPQGTFNSYEIAFAVNYGYQLTEKLGLGTNFKIIYSNLVPKDILTAVNQTIEKGDATTFAFDLGAKYKDVLSVENLDFGLNIQNIGPNATYENNTQSDPLSMTWRMGLSYGLLDSDLSQLRLNADMIKELVNDDFVLARLVTAWFDDDFDQEIESTIFAFGGEYVYYNLLALRAGYYYDNQGEMKGFSFGAGIHHTFRKRYKIGVDFAFEEAGELTNYNKTYSVVVEF